MSGEVEGTTAITVKVAKLGVGTVIVNLEEGATVQDALAMVEDVLGNKIYVNGNTAGDSTPLEDGDVIAAIPPVKGGADK